MHIPNHRPASINLSSSPPLFGNGTFTLSTNAALWKAPKIRTQQTLAYWGNNQDVSHQLSVKKAAFDYLIPQYIKTGKTNSERVKRILQAGDLISVAKLTRLFQKTDNKTEQAAIYWSIFQRTLRGDGSGSSLRTLEETLDKAALADIISAYALQYPKEMQELQGTLEEHLLASRGSSPDELKTFSHVLLKTNQPLFEQVFEALLGQGILQPTELYAWALASSNRFLQGVKKQYSDASEEGANIRVMITQAQMERTLELKDSNRFFVHDIKQLRDDLRDCSLSKQFIDDTITTAYDLDIQLDSLPKALIKRFNLEPFRPNPYSTN